MPWPTPSIEINARPALEAFARGLAELRRTALQPPEEINGLDWVEKNCAFSPETTGHNDAAELYGYQRGIVEVMTDGYHDLVVVPKSTRSGITQCAAFATAYFIAHERTQVAFVQPSEAKAKDFEKTYIEPLIRDVAPLRAVKRVPRKGDVQDTWSLKFFLNGSVFRCYSAEAADNFRSYTGRVQIGDELSADGWASGGERSQGNKQKLFEERSRTFFRRKTIYMSSPRRRGSCRIWSVWERSDKRRYFVPCPHCGGMQYLKWGGEKKKYGLKYDLDEHGHVTDVAYQCEHCEKYIDESHKRWMDSKGQWIATAVPERPGIAGFHVNALMSLFVGASWKTLAQEWIAAQGNPEDLETAVNNILGEPWDEVEGVTVEPEGLALRAKALPAEVPDWVGLLTCGVDAQSGSEDQEKIDAKPPRLEGQVVGWGPEGHFIPIAYEVFDKHYPFSAESKAELDAFRRRPWTKRDGSTLTIQATAIDMGGRNIDGVGFADDVRAYASARAKENVWAIKGNNTSLSKAGSGEKPIWPRKASRKKGSGQWFQVETQAAKFKLDRLMKMTVAGGGFLFTIPQSLVEMPGYLEGLTAEKVVSDKRGRYWKKKGKNTGEPWDTLVYAYIARLGLQTSSKKWADLNLALAQDGVKLSAEAYHGVDKSYNSVIRHAVPVEQAPAARPSDAAPAPVSSAPQAVAPTAPLEKPSTPAKRPRRPAAVRSSWMSRR